MQSRINVCAGEAEAETTERRAELSRVLVVNLLSRARRARVLQEEREGGAVSAQCKAVDPNARVLDRDVQQVRVAAQAHTHGRRVIRAGRRKARERSAQSILQQLHERKLQQRRHTNKRAFPTSPSSSSFSSSSSSSTIPATAADNAAATAAPLR